jgi:hypothetical protein
MLNVVVLFPTPNVVEITANNLAYVLLEIADPSHNKYPAGTVVDTVVMILLVGIILKV